MILVILMPSVSQRLIKRALSSSNGIPGRVAKHVSSKNTCVFDDWPGGASNGQKPSVAAYQHSSLNVVHLGDG
jgi:hypothetical protein